VHGANSREFVSCAESFVFLVHFWFPTRNPRTPCCNPDMPASTLRPSRHAEEDAAAWKSHAPSRCRTVPLLVLAYLVLVAPTAPAPTITKCSAGSYEDETGACVGCIPGKFHSHNITDCKRPPRYVLHIIPLSTGLLCIAEILPQFRVLTRF